MKDNDLNDAISSSLSDALKRDPKLPTGSAGQPQDALLQSLRTAAGVSGGEVEQAIGQFTRGEGALFEATRSAVTRGGTTATTQVANILKETFNLPAGTARLIAALLVKLVPSIGKLGGKQSASKPKPRKKKTTASTAKKKAAGKVQKKKTASSQKPSASAAKKPKKTGAKKTTSKPKTSAKKKTTRGETISAEKAS